MAVLEGLLTNLATEIIKKVYEVKSGRYIGHGEVDRILTSENLNFRESRRGKRQLGQMVDSVVDKLQPYIEGEFFNLPDYEVEAALGLLQTVLVESNLNISELIAHDLEPAWIESHIRSVQATRIQGALLAQDANILFGVVLREVANYIVEISMSLPDFGSKAFRELLSRDTAISDRLDEVLDLLPAALSIAQTSGADYELKFRRSVARKLDKLELFGVDVDESTKRYKLDVAYISLTAAYSDQEDAEGGEASESFPEQKVGFTPRSEAGGSSARVESVLGSTDRLLLRGDAGSGKTTLLQWLAVNCCRKALTSELGAFNEKIPIFLALRQFSSGALPTPSQFLALAAPTLEGREPPGWVYEVLESGRALLLIDGLDEIPALQRNDVRRWLEDLTEEYPLCSYVVTSRPTAVEADWASRLAFRGAELLPMSREDVSTFVDHWHDAVGDDLGEVERVELNELRRNIVRTLARSTVLLSLATSPLLCAMLCALNRDRKAQLPRDRMELYRIALETLLERRDVERKVNSSTVEISLREKQTLLQDLAFWSMLNYGASASKQDAIARCASQLRAMHHVSAAPEAIFDYLMVRSGILREPVVGEIDFVHRTFQEYLAGKEIVSQSLIPMLLEHATDDQWRETIILACGHGTPDQRKQLVGGLLDKGDENPPTRNIYHLLAVACLETADKLEPALTGRIRRSLRGLVPPSSITQAKSLAVAGELALPNLKGFRNRLAAEVGATVRALSLIGTDQALDALVEYGADARKTVQKELIRAWSIFETDEYARRVLSRNSRLKDTVEVRRQAQMDALRHLPGLTGVRIFGEPSREREAQPVDSVSLADLSRSNGLISLAANNVRVLAGERLQSLSSLRRLYLYRAKIDTFAGLHEHSGLEIARLTRADVHDFRIPSALQRLTLKEPARRSISLRPSDSSRLVELELGTLTVEDGLADAYRCSNLARLILDRVLIEGDLTLNEGIIELHLSETRVLGSLDLPATSRVRTASAFQLEQQIAATIVPRLTNLKSFACDSQVSNLLSGLDVEYLAVRGNDFDLARLPRTVKKLFIYEREDEIDLDLLAGRPNLEWVYMMNCRAVRQLPPPEGKYVISAASTSTFKAAAFSYPVSLRSPSRLLRTIRVSADFSMFTRRLPALTRLAVHEV